MRQPMAPPEGSALHADVEWATSAREDAKVEESGGTNSATRVEQMSSPSAESLGGCSLLNPTSCDSAGSAVQFCAGSAQPMLVVL